MTIYLQKINSEEGGKLVGKWILPDNGKDSE